MKKVAKGVVRSGCWYKNERVAVVRTSEDQEIKYSAVKEETTMSLEGQERNLYTF